MTDRPLHETPDPQAPLAHDLPPGVHGRIARRHQADRPGGTMAVTSHREIVADETPVALVYNERSFAVMMASPADLEDFGYGFSLTEGVLLHREECEKVEVVEVTRGFELRMTIAENRALALRARTRALAGRTGCGQIGRAHV